MAKCHPDAIQKDRNLPKTTSYCSCLKAISAMSILVVGDVQGMFSKIAGTCSLGVLWKTRSRRASPRSPQPPRPGSPEWRSWKGEGCWLVVGLLTYTFQIKELKRSMIYHDIR